MGLHPIVLGDDFLCRGRRVALYRRRVGYGDRVVEKDLVRFGRAVVILPVLDDGRIVFINQWRASVNSWVLELPAGRVEDGEDVKAAALRELKEETGYVAEELKPLASFYVSPGYSDELQTAFIAKKLRFIGANPEAGEILNTVAMTAEEYLEKVRGSVIDLKTVATLLLYLYSEDLCRG